MIVTRRQHACIIIALALKHSMIDLIVSTRHEMNAANVISAQKVRITSVAIYFFILLLLLINDLFYNKGAQDGVDSRY
jgi:hypothetical protein